jgi:hypothetical protein
MADGDIEVIADGNPDEFRPGLAVIAGGLLSKL